ncbi:MAG TPA: YciI family protein [Pyrinomonadaceae bacterium]|jgi:uncharacterized protein YciI|nr:YciI family protein [Pyrinomonadaceae bacterium]
MKIRIALITIIILVSSSIALAQDHKMVQFQMAILKKGPKLDSTAETEKDQILHQHLRNVIALLQSGKAAAAGPFGDNTELGGIFIFRAASTEEAKALVDADPAVKAGLIVADIHPWSSEDIFQKVVMPLKFDVVYFGFLKKGPNRKDGDDKSPEIQELQKQHIANINRLAETKKLIMAGPFGDDGELRGVFVFRVDSLKEAEDLAASDPMIKIDRLKIDLHPWQVPIGILP